MRDLLRKLWPRIRPWTGPRDSDMNSGRTELLFNVPPEGGPHGPPEEHEDFCLLFEGGLFCDCAASAHGENY